MNIVVSNVANESCPWCKGKGVTEEIVDHDHNCEAVWGEVECGCVSQKVFVDGNPLEHLLIALGYKK